MDAVRLALVPGYQSGDSINMQYGDIADTLTRSKEDPYTSEFLIWRAGARCKIHPPTKGSRLLVLYSLSNTSSPTQELHRNLADFQKMANAAFPSSAEGPVSPNVPNTTPLSLIPAPSSAATQVYFFPLPKTGDGHVLREYVAREASRFGFACLFGSCSVYTQPPSTPAEAPAVFLRISSLTNYRNQPCSYIQSLILHSRTRRVALETLNHQVLLTNLPGKT